MFLNFLSLGWKVHQVVLLYTTIVRRMPTCGASTCAALHIIDLKLIRHKETKTYQNIHKISSKLLVLEWLVKLLNHFRIDILTYDEFERLTGGVNWQWLLVGRTATRKSSKKMMKMKMVVLAWLLLKSGLKR